MKRKICKLASFIFLLEIGSMLMACSRDDEVTAIYHILDKNGQEVNVINYGDDIMFEVVVTNFTNHTLKFEDWRFFVSAFLVYSSDGQVFNPISYDDLMLHPLTIEPSEQFRRQLIWPWARVPLPVGKYYSTCSLNIDKMSHKTYTINFEIK